MKVTVSGIFAAVATPVDSFGRPDLTAFDRLVDFMFDAGLDGICVGGATGEYPHFEIADRQALVRRAAARVPPGRTLLAGIGGAPVKKVLQLGRSALESGARALLLPMPFFFRYEQHDLAAFARHVASALQAPCLLYDLPGFTNPIATATAIDLMSSEPDIVGIKDSSGSTDRLRQFVAARADASWSLIVGDDALLGEGLEAGWNGGISGLASFCPELIVGLYRSTRAGDRDESAHYRTLLEELIQQVSALPVPWGVRLGLAARGLDTGVMPLPISEARREQIARFNAWLPAWMERLGVSIKG